MNAMFFEYNSGSPEETNRQADRQMDVATRVRQTDRQRDGEQTDAQPASQPDGAKQPDRQTAKQTEPDRHTASKTDRHTACQPASQPARQARPPLLTGEEVGAGLPQLDGLLVQLARAAVGAGHQAVAHGLDALLAVRVEEHHDGVPLGVVQGVHRLGRDVQQGVQVLKHQENRSDLYSVGLVCCVTVPDSLGFCRGCVCVGYYVIISDGSVQF